MTDMRALLSGLEAYHGSLGRHVVGLQAEFDDVSRAWAALDECFSGNAADEFRPIWEGASGRFRDYTERTTHILRILADRIDQLRDAERTTGLSG